MSAQKQPKEDEKGEHSKEHKEVETLRKTADEEKKKAQEMKEMLQRVQAEFENYIKRAGKESAEHSEVSKARILQEFLPLLDSFDAALSSKGESKENEKEGILLLRKQLWSILERNGIKEMHTSGKKFDPEMHECLMFEKDDNKEDDVVLEEIQKGYLFKDKIIRHAKVKVNKRS